MWLGLAYTGLVVVGSVIYTWFAGPLFGDMNAAAVAFMVLVLGVMAVAGIVAFVRQPDPYTRSYFRYELMDVPEVLRGKLDTGPVRWLWQVVPMVLVGIILIPFFA
jgi:multisubunit Na+/H+ antiporter MnhG subunit